MRAEVLARNGAPTFVQSGIALDPRFDDMQISDPVIVEQLGYVTECLNWVAIRNSAPLARRRDAHTYPVGAPHRDESLDTLPQEPDSVLDRATVDVVSLVGAVLDKLVN